MRFNVYLLYFREKLIHRSLVIVIMAQLGHFTPNDPKFPIQWGLHRVGFPKVWRNFNMRLCPEVRVAIIDTGAEATHEDLPKFTGFEAFGEREEDARGHGTMVAGVLCALTDNKKGISGAIPCSPLIYRVYGRYGYRPEEYYRALSRLVEDRISVVNLSLGSTQRDPTEEFLLNRAIDHGVTVIAAAGNRGDAGSIFPGALSRVIAVGSVDDRDSKAYDTATGTSICIAAPGQGIWTTALHNDYKSISGTSFAAPLVTAAVVCAKALRPTARPEVIRKSLIDTADIPNPNWPELRLGAGILNVERFLADILCKA